MLIEMCCPLNASPTLNAIVDATLNAALRNAQPTCSRRDRKFDGELIVIELLEALRVGYFFDSDT